MNSQLIIVFDFPVKNDLNAEMKKKKKNLANIVESHSRKCSLGIIHVFHFDL